MSDREELARLRNLKRLEQLERRAATSPPPEYLSRDQIPSPELGGAEPRTLGVREGFLEGLASDPQERINIAANALFPDVPLSESAQRFGLTNEGDVFYMDAEGRPVLVEHSALGRLAQGVGSGLPAGSGAVAGILSAPMAATGIGLAGTVGLTGAAAAGGETARQAIGDYLLGDRSTNQLEPWQIATEGALAGTGQVFGGALGQGYHRRQVQDIARLDRPETLRAFEQAGQQGITLTPGQATGLRSLQSAEKRLATRVPETIDEMDAFLTQQGEDVIAAFKSNMDAIAPAADAEDVGRSVRSAAASALDDVVRARAERAAPLYERAFESGPIYDDRIAQFLNDPIAQQGLRNGIELQRLDALARGTRFDPTDLAVTGFNAAGDPIIGQVPNMRTMDAVKRGLDDIIKAEVNPQTRKLTQRGAAVQGVKRALVERLDAYNPDYAAARRIYSGDSEGVDDAFSSALRTIANLQDTSILRTVREAFSGTTRSPKMVGRLRAALEAKNPQAWQSLKRLWIDDAVTSALKPTRTGVVNNPAGTINGVLNNPNIAPNLNAALTSREKTALSNLKLVLGRIAKFSIQGSDTASNLAVDQAAREGATSLPAHIIKAINVFQLPEMVAESMTERNMARQAQRLLGIVTSGDQEALKQLKELRAMPESQWRQLMAGSQLVAQGAPTAVSSVFDD